MSAVLVTGATGTVGGDLLVRLGERDVAARAAVRPRPGSVLREGDVPFDFEQPATFAGALEGVDRVFLMRPPRMSDPKAMRPFIDAMAAAGVRHVVFLSVQGAGSNPFVPHHAIERYLLRSGMPCTLLRPSFFMQNLSTTHRDDIRDRGEVFVPAGKGRTNFVDAEDVAEAAAIVLTSPGHEGKAYELTGAQALTYAEVAAALSEVCGRSITYPCPSARRFSERMREHGHEEEFVRVMRSIYAVARLGLAAGTAGDLERLLGRRPRTLREWAVRNAGCFAPAP